MMRVDELVGIRLARRARDQAGPRSWEDDLKTQGWRLAGQGLMAMVWEHRNYPWVLKLFHSSDSGYIEFLKLALQHQDNPAFPRFRGRLVKLTNGVYAVRMEPLQGIDSQTFNELQSGILVPMQRGRLDNWTEDVPMIMWEKYHDFIRAAQQIKYIKSEHVLDLHSGNIMMRDNTPVFTDPLI